MRSQAKSASNQQVEASGTFADCVCLFLHSPPPTLQTLIRYALILSSESMVLRRLRTAVLLVESRSCRKIKRTSTPKHMCATNSVWLPSRGLRSPRCNYKRDIFSTKRHSIEHATCISLSPLLSISRGYAVAAVFGLGDLLKNGGRSGPLEVE